MLWYLAMLFDGAQRPLIRGSNPMSQLSQTSQVGDVAEQSAGEPSAKSGLLPSRYDDVRRHPRFHFRTCAPATIHPLGKRKSDTAPTSCMVRTRDLSRSGLSVLHTAQLFPGQRIEIALTDGNLRTIEVIWCQRLADESYVAGCRFFKPEAQEPQSATAD